MIWISGPAGCGKTTLAASYLDSRSLPCLWYRIDEGDAATIFYYLGLAAKKALPGKKRPLPLLTAEYSAGAGTFARRYFEALFRRLGPVSPVCHKTGKGGFVLVLDNYQEVPPDSGFHTIISHGLSVVPAGANVIVLSRGGPPPQLARLRANGGIFCLGWDRIRFTLDEASGLAGKISASKGQKKPDDSVVARLHEKSEGWAAGIVLVMESAKEIDFPLLKNLTPEEVFHYFATEIFGKADTGTREFLLKTALLPDITPPAAQRLTGMGTAGEILSHLSRNHFFTDRSSDAKPVYQYHPMFREFLLSVAEQSLPAGEKARLKRTAAEILIDSGKHDSAAGLLRDAEDWDGLASLVLHTAPALSAQGRIRTLEEWISAIPGTITGRTPWLRYWLGVCRMPFDPVESRRLFEEAFFTFEKTEEAAGMFLSWAGVVVSLSLSFEDIDRLDQWFSMLERLMRRTKTPLPDEVLLQITSAVFFSAISLPRRHDMEPWIERALILAQRGRDTDTVMQILSNLARCLVARNGDLFRADGIIGMMKDLARSSEDPFIRLTSKLTESLFHVFTASHGECLRAVSDGLALSEFSGMQTMDVMLLGQGVFSALNTGDLETAASLLRKMARSPDRVGKYANAFYYNLSAIDALLRGKTRHAATDAGLAVKLSQDTGHPIACTMTYLTEAQVLHEMGRSQESFRSLGRALGIARVIESRYLEFACTLTKAYFLLCKGAKTGGVRLLRKALELGNTQGYFVTFLWQPSAMTRMCFAALDEGIETDYVRALIRKRNLEPEAPVDMEDWPYPIKIYTLGRFAIEREGEELKFSGKIQHRPLDLLKALVAFGGIDVPEIRLADALWPDADGDAAHKAFITTLYRLRRLIGNDKTIFSGNGKVTIDTRCCWVDAWAFERIAKGIEDVPGPGIPGAAKKMLSLYRGAFLPQDGAKTWTVSMRERLMEKFIGLVKKAARHMERRKRWPEAAAYYVKGIEVDEACEELYQGLMRCYLELGRSSDALSVYRRCKKTLAASLGVAPSSKTEALCRASIRARDGVTV